MVKLKIAALLGIGLTINVAAQIQYDCLIAPTDEEFPKLENVKTFNDFIAQTGRQYATVEERNFRETIFQSKMDFVRVSDKAFDSGISTFKLAINPFADRTLKEYDRVLGSRISSKGEQRVGKHRNYIDKDESKRKNLPDSFDWRELGGVTSAKFQGGDCGSCWSFAVIAALEGHLFRKTGFLVPLSAQDLVDCAEAYGCTGCQGGFQDYAFEYIVQNGVALEAKYPYTQMENPRCHHNETDIGVQIRDYASIKPGDEDRMKYVVASLGPIACSINAKPISFELYQGGLYTEEECNKDELNHSIAVVGYGIENGQEFWIIKNSYSSNWGENGFMKIPRNQNFCGIAAECSYPIL